MMKKHDSEVQLMVFFLLMLAILLVIHPGMAESAPGSGTDVMPPIVKAIVAENVLKIEVKERLWFCLM